MKCGGGHAVKSEAKSGQPTVSLKKSYVKPKLRIYGNLQKITLGGTMSGAGDNTNKMNGKTGG
jgi:hypothetical protein